MDKGQLIQIDLQKVLDDKLGTRAKFVPRPLVSWLKRTVRQDELNEVLRFSHPKTGAPFCNSVLQYLNAEVSVTNPEKLPPRSSRRMIFVSNHPLGGLDGMAIIACLSSIYGDDLRFVVNDLLMAVKPLNDVFLPVNKHGRQDRDAISAINEVMASDAPVVIFPAGLVSRRGDDGEVRDLEWHKMFVNKAVEYHRDVLPMYFSGENSKFFYNFARWRKRLGIKFNIEMIYLPDELMKSRDKKYTITVGDVIPWQSLTAGPGAYEQAQQVKEKVYMLKAELL